MQSTKILKLLLAFGITLSITSAQAQDTALMLSPDILELIGLPAPTLPFVPPLIRQEDTTADRIFTRLMSDNDLRQLYRFLQWSLLNTEEDTVFTRFFFTANSYFGDLFEHLKLSHDEDLEGFSRYALAHLVRLQRGYNDKYNAIHALVERAAIAQGFPAEAIENMEIYLQPGGGLNAFTISGNHSRIIVVLSSELVKTLPLEQLHVAPAAEFSPIHCSRPQ